MSKYILDKKHEYDYISMSEWLYFDWNFIDALWMYPTDNK